MDREKIKHKKNCAEKRSHCTWHVLRKKNVKLKMCSLYQLDFPLTFNKATKAQFLGLARKETLNENWSKKNWLKKKIGRKRNWPERSQYIRFNSK